MNNRWTSIWYLTGRKAFSRSRHGLWTGVTEATLGAVLILVGVVLLAGFITANVLSPLPIGFYGWLLEFVLKPMVAVGMTGIGALMFWNALWKAVTSTERRGAIVSSANQVDLISELRRQRGDFPTIPTRSGNPQPGRQFPYRITPSRRSLWGLATAGLLCLSFVIVVAVLLVTAYVKLNMGRTDWVAGALALPISVGAIWSFFRFMKQLLKNLSIGPTTVELSQFPVVPGEINHIWISQAGVLNLRVLDVRLICMEEATYSQGTSSITARQPIFSKRLFRKRGIKLEAKKPFQHQIEFCIPKDAMHSFQSASNRILWSIEILGQVKNLPSVLRTFEITVVPKVSRSNPTTANATQSA